jgi:hypothetical protein
MTTSARQQDVIWVVTAAAVAFQFASAYKIYKSKVSHNHFCCRVQVSLTSPLLLHAHCLRTDRHPKSIKLTYFDIKGVAESIRLAFTVGDIRFEDERLTREQFTALKPTLPFLQVSPTAWLFPN